MKHVEHQYSTLYHDAWLTLQIINALVMTVYFCSKFAVQNAVMENGLPLCLIDFLVRKKISPQVMKAGRLCQEKMRMNLNYKVIAVVPKRKTKNCLFRKGMFTVRFVIFMHTAQECYTSHSDVGYAINCIYKPYVGSVDPAEFCYAFRVFQRTIKLKILVITVSCLRYSMCFHFALLKKCWTFERSFW